MKTEIYRKIVNCLETIREILHLSQLNFASYFSWTREGYRLMIGLDTNREKEYSKIDLIHILTTIIYNLENYEFWQVKKEEIIIEIKLCLDKYYQKLTTI